MSNFNYDELAAMTCDEIMAIVDEKKKSSPVDIDAQRERNMQRLAEESMILRREIQLDYKEFMLSFDI